MAAFCRADLNYSSPSAEGKPSPVEVDILDGRASDLPGWEVCGFELLRHASAVRDWDDDDEIAAVHHVEMEQLARALTGCDHVIVSGHIKRSPSEAERHPDFAPIRFVHSDFASGHAETIRREFRAAPPAGAVALARSGLTVEITESARRFVVLQFWRNLGPPKMDCPIAFCDARSVAVDDARAFVVADYAGSGGWFEALAVKAPADVARHRWYTFPELTRDEVVAFRTYDTDIVAAGGTFFTPHSAFRDPDVPLGQPARSSIELRATCVFD